MTNHTIGPWAIRDDDEDGVVSIVGGSQIVLATVRTATAEPGEENARLIAAAPELLAALIKLVDSIRKKSFLLPVSTAQAAIDKATWSK